MSQPVRVVLTNASVAYAGVISFDGQVVEVLGFAEVAAQRMPIELIDEVALDGSMFNVFSNPEKGDSYGIQLPVEPNDEERVALEELVEAIQGAVGGS